MKQQINKLLLFFAASTIMASCVDEYSSDFSTERPTDVALEQYLNEFDILKNYVDKNSNPSFMLGTGISAAALPLKEKEYSLTISNFEEITFFDAIHHNLVVTEDGTLNLSTVSGLIETAEQSNLSIYGHTLIWHANQSDFLDRSIAPTVIPEAVIPPNVQEGTADLLDFENDPLGKEYPMTTGTTGKSKVVDDAPERLGNKVLQIGSREEPANQSLPIFTVKLPEGITVGHCVELIFDAYCVDGIGQFGSGARISINGKQGAHGTNFSSVKNKWGEIVIPISLITTLTAEDKALNEFTLEFGNRTGGAFFYFDNIRMKYATAETGSLDIDFESNNLGDTYPMTKGDVATVVSDPVNSDNKVLSIGSSETLANQSEPIFTFKMPEGKTLGDCKNLVLDIYVVNNNGMFGQGLRRKINDKEGTVSTNFSGLGAKNNAWGKDLSVNLSMVPLTEEDKKLTEFTLSFGNRTGTGHYLYDNIRLEWESGDTEPTIIPEQIIWKTEEEVKGILTDAMESWISGVMQASNGYVKTWEIINEPMDDTVPTELKRDPNPPTDPKNWIADQNFYWQDYLGKDYARLAVKFARQYGGEDLKLFVNDYDLEIAGNSKCKGLIEMIKYWESDGITKIDGIGVQMHLKYSMNTTKQAENRTNIEQMFSLLAATNKLIRISQLDISVTDENGKVINPASMTYEQEMAVSDFYNFVIRKYFETIPAENHHGITLWTPVSSSTQIGLWDTGYNRKITYTGFVEGLTNK